MFYYISGKLAKLDGTFAVVDAGGVGFKMTISKSTYYRLSGNNEAPTVKLYTYMAVREDGTELFGFASEEELSAFKLLITVSGVGPKAAISILSTLTPEKLALAICTEDKKAISQANGIGAKTAARIILELHDKIQKQLGTVSASTITPSISDGISTQQLCLEQCQTCNEVQTPYPELCNNNDCNNNDCNNNDCNNNDYGICSWSLYGKWRVGFC